MVGTLRDPEGAAGVIARSKLEHSMASLSDRDVEFYVERIRIALGKPNFDMARRIIDEAEHQHFLVPSGNPWTLSLPDAGLGNWSIGRLETIGIITVGALSLHKRSEVAWNCGAATMRQIDEIMKAFDLEFRDEQEFRGKSVDS